MERASKFIGSLKLSAKLPPEELAIAAWPVAVGKRIAFHSTARCLVRDKLVVEVDDGVWKTDVALSTDDADSIRDPVLRQIYKEKRKKASA
jgi:hypothetical protein